MDSVYKAYKDGKFNEAIRHGVMRKSVLRWIEIYDVYINYRSTGMTYTKAVEITAGVVCAAEITVKKAIAEVV